MEEYEKAKTHDHHYPPFQLNKSRYNQETFTGRFRHFLDVIDPRTLFVSDEHLNNAVQLLEDFENNSIDPEAVSNRELWEAQKIKQAILHPDTGEKVFMPFRMSGFIPFGSPIVTGLLIPNPTMMQTIFWQWLNQSHNACVNYANRNASKPTSVATFVQGYIGANVAAISIAVGLTLLVRKAEAFKPATRMLIQRFVPFPAVSAASVTNVVMMRYHELDQGIEVMSKDGTVQGTSKKAAKKALQEMAISRAVLPAPILLIPPIVLSQLEKTHWMRRNPRLHLPINATLVTASFAFALPLAIAVFPQISKIKTTKLEEEIRAKAKEEKYLYYNKGL